MHKHNNAFSDNDLLRFLYDELPKSEADALVMALSHDDELLNRYEMFQSLAEETSKLQFEPSQESLDAIMAEVSLLPEPVLEVAPTGPSDTVLNKHGWRNALLTGACVLVFGFVTIWTNKQVKQLANAETVTAPVEESATWDDNAIDMRIEDLQVRTKSLSEPLL